MGPASLDPAQHTISASPQQRHILGQQNQSKRQHPKPKDRKDAENASDDQQKTRGNPQPSGGWLAQPTDHALKALRKASNQQLQPAFPIRVAGRRQHDYMRQKRLLLA